MPHHEDPYKLLKEAITPEIEDGMVLFVDIAIFGKPGCGKTTTQKKLAEVAVEGYQEKYAGREDSKWGDMTGKELVNCPMSQSFDALVESLDEKPVQVLNIDDPLRNYHSRSGRTKEVRSAIADFLEIRHELERRMETKTGVVIIIWGSQIFSGLDKTFREGVVQIFKTPLVEDKTDIIKALGGRHDLFYKLKKIAFQIYIKHNHKARGDMVVSLGNGAFIGELHLPMPKIDYTYWVKAKGEKALDKLEKWNREVVEIAQNIILNAKIDWEGDKKTAQRRLRKYIRDNHPQLWLKAESDKGIMRDILDEIADILEDAGINADEIASSLATEHINTDGTDLAPKFHFNEYNALLGILNTGQIKGLPIYCKLLLDHPLNVIEAMNEDRLSMKNSKNQKIYPEQIAPLVVGGKMGQQQAGTILGYTQGTISKMMNKGGYKKIEGLLNTISGQAWEEYVVQMVKSGHDLIANGIKVIDSAQVQFIAREGEKGQPDVRILYKDGKEILVSCKYRNKDKFDIHIRSEDFDVQPELERFMELTDQGKLSEMIILDLNEFSDYLTLLHYIQDTPIQPWQTQIKVIEDFPMVETISRSRIDKGQLPNALWVKYEPPKKPIAKADFDFDDVDPSEEKPKQKWGKKQYPIICADCGEEATVPFEPKGSGPLYCGGCYHNHK